jgi:hypothetical protein
VAALIALAALAAAAVAGAPAPAVKVRPKRFQPVARFTITYAGSGTFHTRYHATPPNPGGAADTDDATDTSSQKWSLTYEGTFKVPRCAPGRKAPRDPCRGIAGPSAAHGPTSENGTIDHVHIDGLYTQLNASESCRVRFATPAGAALSSGIDVRYSPRRRTISLTAGNPLGDALIVMPQTCPGDTDPIDGFIANYFTPGFSFATGYGPDRWFTAKTISIPVAVLHRAARITVRLGATRAGTPPRDCSVPYPVYQRCSTGGSWAGVLTLKAPG